MAAVTFKLTIINPDGIIYEGQAQKMFLQGDLSEFELLPHHAPLISKLKEGDVVIDDKKSIHVKGGLVRFYDDECVILAELKEEI